MKNETKNRKQKTLFIDLTINHFLICKLRCEIHNPRLSPYQLPYIYRHNTFCPSIMYKLYRQLRNKILFHKQLIIKSDDGITDE